MNNPFTSDPASLHANARHLMRTHQPLWNLAYFLAGQHASEPEIGSMSHYERAALSLKCYDYFEKNSIRMHSTLLTVLYSSITLLREQQGNTPSHDSVFQSAVQRAASCIEEARWAESGYPVFNLTADFFHAMQVSDFGAAADDEVKLPYDQFLIRFPTALEPYTERCFVAKTPMTDALKVMVTGDVPDFVVAAHYGPLSISSYDEAIACAEWHAKSIATKWSNTCTYRELLQPPTTFQDVVDLGDGRFHIETKAVDAETLAEAGEFAFERHQLRTKVLLNFLMYVNACGALPTKKLVGPEYPIEREHNEHPRFRVGRPIKLSAQTRAAIQGGNTLATWKLNKRLLVRGHWTRQAYGPGRTLRKDMYIQPYWRGPEDKAPSLRGFEVK